MGFLPPSSSSFLPDPYHSHPQLPPLFAKMGKKGTSCLAQYPEYSCGSQSIPAERGLFVLPTLCSDRSLEKVNSLSCSEGRDTALLSGLGSHYPWFGGPQRWTHSFSSWWPPSLGRSGTVDTLLCARHWAGP